MSNVISKPNQEMLELAGRYVKEAIEQGEPNWRAWYVTASKGYKKGKKRKDKKK